ncbi:hypothetical protein K0M31_004220 [Melipona bicolor]|uniref:Uncharacterized protein n=1 Tax=Melipona bicolor TaxID=60889 RepID=A0AA40KN95_9HYME|nr:hypothetical protein K0M31_004220 [Melipona bicolor]
MTLSLYLSVFWIIGIVWTVYYWCSENSCKNKVIFDLNSDDGNNIMSIDSSDASDNDQSSNCNKKRLKYESQNTEQCQINHMATSKLQSMAHTTVYVTQNLLNFITSLIELEHYVMMLY